MRGIAAALHLDQGRDRILIEEEMVDTPAAASILLIGKSCFTSDQQPPPGRVSPVLIAGEQARELGNQSLENLFAVVWLLSHLQQFILAAQEVDAAAHAAESRPEPSRRPSLARTLGPQLLVVLC